MFVNTFTPRSLCKLAAISHGVAVPSDDDADVVLWEFTAFPVCGIAHWVMQCREFFARVGDQDAIDAYNHERDLDNERFDNTAHDREAWRADDAERDRD